MDFEDLVNSNVGRIVAFVLTPVLIPSATAAAAWLQDAVGINLDGSQLTAYVVAVAAGIAVVAATWLRNLGAWEVGQAELIKLHELGQQEIDRSSGDPTRGLAKPE